MRYVKVPDVSDSGALYQRVPVAEPPDPGYPTPRLPESDPWATAVSRAIDEIRASEFAAEVRAFEPDPNTIVDGHGCLVRDLGAYEARMAAALDEPELEIGR